MYFSKTIFFSLGTFQTLKQIILHNMFFLDVDLAFKVKNMRPKEIYAHSHMKEMLERAVPNWNEKYMKIQYNIIFEFWIK